MKPDSIIELLQNSKRTATLVERERAARRGAPGWLGITRRENPQAVMFGDDAIEMEIHERSPAYTKGHLRTGYVLVGGIISVEGHRVALEDFERERFLAGTEAGLRYYDPNATGHRAGILATVFKLSKWPRIRPWEARHQRVECGRRVAPKDRRKFIAEMFYYLQERLPAPRTGAAGERRTGWMIVWGYLTFLVLVRDNFKNPGVWGRQIDTAKELGLSIRIVNDFHQILTWVGILKRRSYPTPHRDSNLYEICWPMRDTAALQPKPVPPPPSASIRRLQFDAAVEPVPAAPGRHLRFDSEEA